MCRIDSKDSFILSVFATMYFTASSFCNVESTCWAVFSNCMSRSDVPDRQRYTFPLPLHFFPYSLVSCISRCAYTPARTWILASSRAACTIASLSPTSEMLRDLAVTALCLLLTCFLTRELCDSRSINDSLTMYY